MQKELTSSLKMTIAKLELKQLEFIDKLSVEKTIMLFVVSLAQKQMNS